MSSTTTTTTTTTVKPITEDDRIVVDGRYLVYKGRPDERFLMKGIAFPDPLPDEDKEMDPTPGYIAILRQLRNDLGMTELNTIRMYVLDPTIRTIDYAEFFNVAAELGFYVLIPLTAAGGAGVLSRDKPAPKCYNHKLFNYGKQVIDEFGSYPNVLGGVLANEVMNSLISWTAAPCILAYARDLKRYMRMANKETLPLFYTAQHDGIGAQLSPAEAMRMTVDYMTCADDTTTDPEEAASIDVFGINIESWCSWTQKFEKNEDGSIGTYLDLYNAMNDANIPLVFSELGCSLQLYNKDNGLPKGARDWSQLTAILGEENGMVDEWSGFSAYAYDGPTYFQMMSGGPWDGVNVLKPKQDMINFGDALKETSRISRSTSLPTKPAGTPPTCKEMATTMKKSFKLNLYPVHKIRSYRMSWFAQHIWPGTRVRGGSSSISRTTTSASTEAHLAPQEQPLSHHGNMLETMTTTTMAGAIVVGLMVIALAAFIIRRPRTGYTRI